MGYSSNKTLFKKHFEKMMYIQSFSMNNVVDELIEESVFEYKKYFVKFFEYMAQNCSSKKTEYTDSSYLRNKIDEFGEMFKTDYLNAFTNTKKKKLLEATIENKLLKADDLKKKFCGNLLEIINGLYAIDFPIVDGFEFDCWCNNGNDDFMGVDGILRQKCDKNIRIPMNTKHSNWNEITKFAPFQKLGNWVLMQLRNLGSDEDKLEMLNLPYYGVIFTDYDTGKWASSNFPNVYVVNDTTLRNKLGKAGLNVGCVDVWKHWYKIVK